MAAKTQDAAGVLVRAGWRVRYQPEAAAGKRWRATRDEWPDDEECDESLYVIAQRLNLDIEEFNRCAALMEPAAPTGETLANTLKEKWALRKAADFDRILDVLPKGPRCRDCADSDGRCMNEAEPRPPCDPVEHVIELLRSALAAPTGETDSQILDRLLVRCKFYFNGVRVRTHDELTAALDNYALAALTPEVHAYAARAPAPSAPQEPRGEPSEGMVEAMGKVWMAFWDGWRDREAMPVQGTPNGLADVRAAFRKRYPEAVSLSTGGRDAD